VIIENRQIIIEPLSPVFVWSGKTLVPKFDFIVEGNDVIIIDFDKMIREAKSDKELEQREKFVKELHGVKLEFKNVIRGKTIDQILDINPYIIPGTEVKGLIRTAVINELIKSNKNNFDKTMKRILNEMDNMVRILNEKKKPNLKNLGLVVEHVIKSRPPIQAKYVYDALKTLLISDPMVQSAEFRLSEIRVLNINGELLTSKHIIAFTKGKLTYDAKIIKPKDYGVYKNSEVEGLNSKITWDLITTSLKKFSKVIIADEISKINKYLNKQNKHVHKEDLHQYLEFMKRIENLNECVPLRIGMFTGHTAKTIEVRDDVKRKREELLSRFYDKRWDNSTLKVVEGVGAGWIKMCIK